MAIALAMTDWAGPARPNCGVAPLHRMVFELEVFGFASHLCISDRIRPSYGCL